MDHPPSRANALQAVRTLLAFIGDDPSRPGLAETPERVLAAWSKDWGAGYAEPATPLVKLFDAEMMEGSESFDQPMIIVRDLSFFSTCEHHMAPFYGAAAIAYIPDPKRGHIGLSKFARVLDHFSRRLQVQERLTDQVADFLVERLSPHIAVIMEATHLCMVSRGVRQPNSLTATSALRGYFFTDGRTRKEFYDLVNAPRLRCS